jgi:hypothetical protein
MSKMKGNKEFSEDIKLKCLLWSNRHCCVCDSSCGLDIEIAHIDPKGGESFDNAIPVCYKCHAQIGRYNKEHPRGNKYRIRELEKVREQIYEKYTRHLVPPLLFYLVPRSEHDDRGYNLPQVGFVIENRGLFLPVKFKVKIKGFLGGKELELKVNPYYTGDITWNLNAGHIFFGNFVLPQKCVDNTERLIIEVQVTAIDQYDRPHELLPNCYTYVRKEAYWFTEPTSFSELERFKVRP